MAVVKFSEEERQNVRIIKCLLQLSDTWKKELKFLKESFKENEDTESKIKILEKQLLFIERIVNDSNLSDEEINIINDTLINKKDSIEYIGRKYYYSESGLRNRINVIIKKILTELYK